MLSPRISRTMLLAMGLLVLLYLASVAEAQSHNDKHYQTLNVPKDASPRQIKKAYRKLSIEVHPDRAKDEEERKVFHERMVELNKAFEVLSDPEKKQMYDAYGEDGPNRQPTMQHANFDHLFNAFFGGAFGGGHPQHAGHGQQRQQQRQRQQQCVQTVTCRGNVCQQTTVCH